LAFQVGVAFADHHQAAERAAQFALRRLELAEGGRVVECFGRDLDGRGLGARLHHLGQRVLLKGGFALDGGHDVGHQVGAALVLVQHFRPGRFGLLVQALEVVVAAAREQQAQQADEDQVEKAGFHDGTFRKCKPQH
jgi:hypothetical protein